MGAEPAWIDARDFRDLLDTEHSRELERLRGRLRHLRDIEREFLFVDRDSKPGLLPCYLARLGLECNRYLSRLRPSERQSVEPLVRLIEAEYRSRMGGAGVAGTTSVELG